MENRWGKVKKVADFTFLGFKITADGDCNDEIQTLALGRTAITNLDRILKSREHVRTSYHFPIFFDFLV